MSVLLDSSVLVAALVKDQSHHTDCLSLLNLPELHVYSHSLGETFAFLTGGRMQPRIPPSMVAILIKEGILPFVEVVTLSPDEWIAALASTQSRGIRGGAIYDYLHLTAANKVNAQHLYTLNIRHFLAFHRVGDPEIVHPSLASS